VCYRVLVISKTKKAKVIKEAQIHALDTGSAAVQISILSKRIEELAAHLKKNNKDNHSRRGLLAMVAGRQAHMKYLMKKSPKEALALQKKISLKK
jgi:small subunit ribosomal protein S15